jgi:peptidoglycan/LPS O-acetylase OafA/YrhL
MCFVGILLSMSESVPVVAKSSRLTFIDALRGFACLWVIAVHAHGTWITNPDDVVKLSWQYPILSLWGLGMKGVDLFIVLSGFCLSWPIFRRDGLVDVSRVGKAFFVRRFWRIIPVYYAALLFAVVLLTSGLPKFAPLSRFVDVLPSLFGVQTIFSSFAGRVNGSLWSIALELQLYCLFPLIVRLIDRYGVLIVCIVLFGIGALSGVTDSFANVPYVFGYFSLLGRIGQFACGIYVAFVMKSNRFYVSPIVFVMCSFGFVLGLLAHVSKGGPIVRGLTYSTWGVAFACSILVLSRLKDSLWITNPIGKALSAIGTISYSVYVVHFPIVCLFVPLKNVFGVSPIREITAFCLTGFPVILIVGILLHISVERWSMLRASAVR